MSRFVIAYVCGATLALVSGCSGSTNLSGSSGDGRDPISNEELFGTVRCPLDPDNYIGGSGVDPVCPDFWVCETIPGSEHKRCANPGPSYPSDSGTWVCEDTGSEVICTAGEGALPDGGAADGWNCVTQENQVVCTQSNPSYPSEGGEDGWNCWFEEFSRYCEENNPDAPSGGPSGSDSPTSPDGTTSTPGGTSSNPDEPSTDEGDGDDGNQSRGPRGSDDSGDSSTPSNPMSPTDGTPFSGVCVDYYAAKWDGGGFSCTTITDGNGVFCLDGSTAGYSDGCGMASVSGSGPNIVVTLPSNCQFIEASSKCATTCEDSGPTGNSNTFEPCGQHSISHTEAMWCCS